MKCGAGISPGQGPIEGPICGLEPELLEEVSMRGGCIVVGVPEDIALLVVFTVCRSGGTTLTRAKREVADWWVRLV